MMPTSSRALAMLATGCLGQNEPNAPPLLPVSAGEGALLRREISGPEQRWARASAPVLLESTRRALELTR